MGKVRRKLTGISRAVEQLEIIFGPLENIEIEIGNCVHCQREPILEEGRFGALQNISFRNGLITGDTVCPECLIYYYNEDGKKTFTDRTKEPAV